MINTLAELQPRFFLCTTWHQKVDGKYVFLVLFFVRVGVHIGSYGLQLVD